MDEKAIPALIIGALAGVDQTTLGDDTFFFANPDRDPNPDQMFPFATLVTSDAYDDSSKLDRPGVYRLNMGVSKETFRSLFGPDATTKEWDYAELDTLFPHPVYGKMFWLAVLNPSEATYASLQSLLAEPFDLAVSRNKRGRKTTPPTE